MRVINTIGFSLFFLLIASVGFCQSMHIGSAQKCSGDTVSVSVDMIQCDSLGAITLYIGYDTTKIKFLKIDSITPFAAGLMYNCVSNEEVFSGKISVSWISPNGDPVNFGTQRFAVLYFTTITDSSLLQFLNNCEIANYNAQPLFINYQHGKIKTILHPTFLQQPNSIQIQTDSSGFLHIKAIDYQSIQWQTLSNSNWTNLQNNIHFQGTNNDTLYILNANSLMNNTQYRVLISGCNQIVSNSITLNISTDIQNHKKINSILLTPNPASSYISFSNSFKCKLSIIELNGNVISEKEIEPFSKIDIHNLPSGIYFIKIYNTENKGIPELLKFIKISDENTTY